MNNFVKLHEISNEGVEWMFQQFQSTKDTNLALTINKMLQVCVGKLGIFKSIDVVGTSIRCGYAYDMVMNTTLGVLPTITSGGWNFQGDNRILIYLNFSNIVCVQEESCRKKMV